MGVNDIAIRFTEDRYATKNEVSRELKISVIDGVWDKILSYRAPFCHYLAIRSVDKNQLRICLCPTISSNLNAVEAKLLRIVSEANKLDETNFNKQYFHQTCLIKNLQNVALSNLAVSDEQHVKGVVQGTVNDVALANYLKALKYIEKKYESALDVDFLAELYSKVTGNDELTSFYRTKEFDDSGANVLISRVYKSAPAHLIESMMDSLFNFVEKANISPLSRALISYYYIQFVKPFDKYNNEISVLFAKAVLAHYSLAELAVYLPFETLLNENEGEMEKIFHDVQTSSDVTYFLVFALRFIGKEFDKMLDSFVEYSVKVIKNDFYQLDEEEKPEEVSLFDLAEEPETEPVKEEEKPASILEEAPKVEPVVKKEVEVKTSPIIEKPAGLAVSYIPEELDEKTAARLERHLLELDVRLSKGQAHFYARHCTLGMYYTIDQYKKATKCVYETARTSMDKLVEFGYYVKTSAGKKFVYTPVKRN